MRREAWSAVALLVLAAALFAASTRIEGNPLVAIGPDFYPQILVGLLAILAVCLLIASILDARRAERSSGRQEAAEHDSQAAPAEAVSTGNRVLVVCIFLIFIAYAIALPWVGFRLATFVFLAVMRPALGPVAGMRGWLGVLLFALLGTALAWYVFEQHLSVLLPRGRLTGF